MLCPFGKNLPRRQDGQVETWEIVLLVVAALVAVRTLASLMRQRRNRMVEAVQTQVDQYREHEREMRRRQRQKEQQEEAA